MPVTLAHARLIAREFIRDNDLQPTAEGDIMLLHKSLSEDDDEANKAALDEWLASRPHVKKTVEQQADEAIDIALERKAFGADASPAGRASLYRKYGEALFEQRREAWGASPGTIQSGTEPGAEGHSAETVKKAAKIVADQDGNSPFNPNKRYLNEQTRVNECAKFAVRFGTAAVRKQCAKFGCDIAGRPLRKQA